MVNASNFPAAYTAMDTAARQFWAYPDADWQGDFLAAYAAKHGDVALAAALGE